MGQANRSLKDIMANRSLKDIMALNSSFDSIEINDIKLVFFDLETSGFKKSADILQIAAKCEEDEFCRYANPTQPIMPRVTEITGLKNEGGTLLLYDERVPSIPLQEVLREFKEWLAELSKPCILVAHNARFDISFLLRNLENNSMIEDFENLVAGFSDTLVTLRKLYPQRKGPGMFKLSTLARDLLQIESTENFHNAIYDVEILEKIASTIPKENLIVNGKTFTEALDHETQLQNEAILRQSLDVLKNVISEGMIKKIASAGINFAQLQDTYEESGKEGVVQLLSAEQENNKPRVTKNKRILEKIIRFLETIFGN